MKKATIITPPEFEGLLLETLGRAEVAQLKEVTGPEFESLRSAYERGYDYKPLYEKVHARYSEFLKAMGLTVDYVAPSVDYLRRVVADPEGEVNAILGELDQIALRFRELREGQRGEVELVIGQLREAVGPEDSAYQAELKAIMREVLKIEHERMASDGEIERGRFELEEERRHLRGRLVTIRALEPEYMRSSFTVGVAKNAILDKLVEYLQRYPNVTQKTVRISEEESFIYIFGSEESRKWVEALFLVFEVRDIFEVLGPRDVLLVLDPDKRKEVLERYEESLELLGERRVEPAEAGEPRRVEPAEYEERIMRLDEEHRRKVDELKREYDGRLKELESRHARAVEELKGLQQEALNKVAYLDNFLRIAADESTPVLRTKVISVLQGWVPDYKVAALQEAVAEVEAKAGERLFVQFEEPRPDEHPPTPPPEMKPAFLQPAWTLTTLRGWPSLHEVNPSYITIIVFSFQFGLMFGDVGQGAVFLLLGLLLSRKYKRGMMSKLGVLFVPMGIAAIIFGFMYGSVFLVESLFQPLLFSPIHSVGKLMKTVLGIAVAEMGIGLALGAINKVKEGEPLGAMGEHGVGAILFIVGLYLGGLEFLGSGDIFKLFSHWTFYMMIVGLVLSTIEPMLIAITHGHFGMEAMGEGIGALLMTFVEGLANFFSFLRIAAFALAHASLAIAAESLGAFMGPGGLVLTNAIAMTFEFVSSTVQSLRLLYYEFMGKFFHGGGIPYRPYTSGRRREQAAQPAPPTPE